MINLFRLPFVFLAMLSLLFGLWTGLGRIGWEPALVSASMHHGAIMVGGFLGTLISLEKIIPLKKKYLYIFPVTSGLSVVLFALGQPAVSFALLVGSSAGLSAVFLHYFLREKNMIYLLMLGGAVCWLVGNILLMSKEFYPLAFPWWLAFTLFIITSERLELMKFLPVTEAIKKLLVIFLALFITGILIPFHGSGQLVSGLALVAISLWLLRYDMIGISIRKEGLPRFVAIALLCGYVSMLLTGIFFLALKQEAFAYDAIVHTYFLGFVFSMIFAHGPIILPGVLGISLKPYHKILYMWLIFLHLSWIMRIASDILINLEMRRISGIVSALAIVSYFVTIASLTIISQRRHAKIL